MIRVTFESDGVAIACHGVYPRKIKGEALIVVQHMREEARFAFPGAFE